MSKDRYLELNLSESLPERRKKSDRRKLNTILNPEVERRKRIRRKQEIAKKEIERQKKEKDRKNFINGMIILLIPSSFFLWFVYSLVSIVVNIYLDNNGLF